ncbi:MAG: hypothetical protein V2A73_02820, partial [Pseudomonadota bacterium]
QGTGNSTTNGFCSHPVQTPEHVDVYMRSAPEGFSLAENEVSVMEGYEHKVLGYIRVGYGDGDCPEGALGQKDLIREIQERAHWVGANAAIYLLPLPHARAARC